MNFMKASIEKLVENLGCASKFKHTSKYFKGDSLKLLSRKGVYPHDYTDLFEKMKETELPRIDDSIQS